MSVRYTEITDEHKARFHTSYEKREDGCWIWIKGKFSPGPHKRCYPYGAHNTRTAKRNKTWLAHRFSWTIHNEQDIPDGLLVLHSCDVPECVNPDHLSLGTHKDNMQQASARGRFKQIVKTCEHCGVTGSGPSMNRWHGKNCRNKPQGA